MVLAGSGGVLYHADIESSTTSIWHARACIVISPETMRASRINRHAGCRLSPIQNFFLCLLCLFFVIAGSESAHDGMLRSHIAISQG